MSNLVNDISSREEAEALIANTRALVKHALRLSTSNHHKEKRTRLLEQARLLLKEVLNKDEVSLLLLKISDPAALLLCRVEGACERYESVVHVVNNQFQKRPCEGETEAMLLAYKGFALFKSEKIYEALSSLEEASNAFRSLQHPLTGRPEKMFWQTEESLVQCCNRAGEPVPLPPLVKFPRTPHLFQPSGSTAVTDDDLVLSKEDGMWKLMEQGAKVTLCEKLDGANLGLRLARDGTTVLAQNRTHYLQSGEHPQFSPLREWMALHNEALVELLSSSKRGYILYGEWLVAKHSVSYDRLPGHFIAFDLYDIESGRFVSQAKLHSMLDGTDIPVAPVIGQRSFSSDATAIENAFLQLLNSSSTFKSESNRFIEGIVLRIESDEWLEHRAKVVRPDFVAGAEWAGHKVNKQTLDSNFTSAYLKECYKLKQEDTQELPCKVSSPRERVSVTYDSPGDGTTARILISKGSHKNAPLSPGQLVDMPRNLSWLFKDEVAISSTPKNAEQVKAFVDALNIGTIITLTQEEPLPPEFFSPSRITNLFYPIPNYSVPTLSIMDEISDEIVRQVASGKRVMEHCGGGKGRAGTIAACLLMRFGRNGVWARICEENPKNSECLSLKPGVPILTAKEAVSWIRSMRPGSIETEIQEEFCMEYEKHLWRQLNDFTDSEESDDISSMTLISHDNLNAKKVCIPKYILLMGLPGSGKSSIAAHLEQATKGNQKPWMWMSQDVLSHRVTVQKVGQISAEVARGQVGGIIVDCTNVTSKHRSEWLKVMHQPPAKDTVLVYFRRPADICARRVACRVNHPSIPFGRGERIVHGFASQLEPPTQEETKLFGSIHVIDSSQDAIDLLRRWGV